VAQRLDANLALPEGQPMTSGWSISAERAAHPYTLQLKLGHDACEINVWVKHDELGLLPRVLHADWGRRGSMRIGTSAGTPVFRSCDGELVFIMVGHDDETWDFGVTIPQAVFVEVIAEMQAVGGVGP
jgi:hypothetical protein